MPENEATSTGTETGAEGGGQQEQSLTQADVDRIVKDRVARVQAKYADYEELKVKAEGAKTLEERLGALETELSTTKTEALRSRIAAEFGISTKAAKPDEPSDADLFLTGADEASLTAQAQRLAGREADRKKQGNVAPKEGATDTTGGPTKDLREFAKGLFGTAD
jgi:hypothetical protein